MSETFDILAENINDLKYLGMPGCEEGDLNPEVGFRSPASHSRDSHAESRSSARLAAADPDPKPTQLSLDFTQKTGTVPVVESTRLPARRRKLRLK